MRLLVYRCPGGHATTATVDPEAGAYMPIVACPTCQQPAEVSEMLWPASPRYSQLAPARLEWREPRGTELSTLDPIALDHVRRGGLMLAETHARQNL